jgi:SAM-dependent methyltransferase
MILNMNNLDQHLGTGVYSPQKYWSARARNYNGDYFKAVCAFIATKVENRSMDRIQRYFLKMALDQLNTSDKSVMEYGCGVGRWVKIFQGKGYQWTGVDISDEMLSIAVNRFPNADFLKVNDGYLIHFPDQTFDLVYSVTVLHHNDYEQQEKIVAQMARVLKNGGNIILLEDLGEKTSFNMFPRSKEAWFTLAKKYQLKNIWSREIKYWILRDFILFQRLQARPKLWSGWRRMIGWVDFLLDPYLLRYARWKYPTAALMIFEKQSVDWS